MSPVPRSVIDHPILRAYKAPNLGGRAYVLIGRFPGDDEVWTRQPATVRGILSTLDTWEIWTRAEWERDIIAGAKLNERYSSTRCTNITTYEPSQIAERVFSLLRDDGVFREPIVPELSERGIRYTKSRRHWIVDQEKLEEWVAVRLLLLDTRDGYDW